MFRSHSLPHSHALHFIRHSELATSFVKAICAFKTSLTMKAVLNFGRGAARRTPNGSLSLRRKNGSDGCNLMWSADLIWRKKRKKSPLNKGEITNLQLCVSFQESPWRTLLVYDLIKIFVPFQAEFTASNRRVYRYFSAGFCFLTVTFTYMTFWTYFGPSTITGRHGNITPLCPSSPPQQPLFSSPRSPCSYKAARWLHGWQATFVFCRSFHSFLNCCSFCHATTIFICPPPPKMLKESGVWFWGGSKISQIYTNLQLHLHRARKLTEFSDVDWGKVPHLGGIS